MINENEKTTTNNNEKTIQSVSEFLSSIKNGYKPDTNERG